MSLGEFAALSPSIDWRSDSVLSKRKLDDSASEDGPGSALSTVKMRKDSPDAAASLSSHGYADAAEQSCRVSAAGAASSSKSMSTIHFFVRMISGGNTVVVHASPDDTIESVHQQIRRITGIPIIEQRLIYRGKQLSSDQTLADCGIQNDAGLQLVGRMRSTGHPRAWQLVNDTVSAICCLCRSSELAAGAPARTIRMQIQEFLRTAPRDDVDLTMGHLQVFKLAGAPSALVMLFLSPHKGNRACAEESIRQFLSPNIHFFPQALQTQCTFIILEFCKLLREAAPMSSLYRSCRSTLGSLLEAAHGSRYFVHAKASAFICDLYPFVEELAIMVLHGLDASYSLPSFPAMDTADVNEFVAFFQSVRQAMEDRLGGEKPITLGESSGDCQLYEEEIFSFRRLYIQILVKAQMCIEKVEEYLEANGLVASHRLCWSQYLLVLKELNSISKLYHPEEERFKSFLMDRKKTVNILIGLTKRKDDHLWLLHHKDVTDFESRRHLLMMTFPEIRDEYDELHEMLIDRSQLLAESFEYIGRAEKESLHKGLFMEFKNEEATGPGVLREWFCLTCQAIFNPDNPLFLSCPNDLSRFFPNPASGVDPLHLEYFSFCGRLIALALMHKVQVGIKFDRVFFLQLAGKYISLEDIQEADPYLYASCKKVLELDADLVDSDVLGLTFTRESDELGSRAVVELCPGGKFISVDSKNRQEYVNLLIQDRFAKSVCQQVTHFAEGFGDILCDANTQQLFFESMDVEDLDQMLNGSDGPINIGDWKAHTVYNGYEGNDLHICWFWKIVEEMSSVQQRMLLFFWTSVKHLPVDGFKGLGSRLYIFKIHDSHDHLPYSHTCFYRLCLPPYPSIAVMRSRFDVITQEHVARSFGMS